MARMRYVKPEYWTDSKIIKLGPWARSLYIGSWNFAICEVGHLDDDAMALKLKVLPADPIDADEVLEEIVAAGRIVRKTLPDGRTYLVIPRLPNHQKTETRWGTRCPYCAAEAPTTKPAETQPSTSDLSEPRQRSVEVPDTLPFSAQEGIGGEGIGKGAKRPPAATAPRKKRKPPEPKSRAQDTTPPGMVAAAVYDHSGGFLNFIAVRGVAAKLLAKDLTVPQVTKAMCFAYDKGKPLTVEVVGQVINGKTPGSSAVMNGVSGHVDLAAPENVPPPRRDPFANRTEGIP